MPDYRQEAPAGIRSRRAVGHDDRPDREPAVRNIRDGSRRRPGAPTDHWPGRAQPQGPAVSTRGTASFNIFLPLTTSLDLKINVFFCLFFRNTF